VTEDSYGGALLFIAFLAEMRHPWDFWKGMLVAQVFICFVYIFFGAFVSKPSLRRSTSRH
jgi:Kef-type K+ transport system membrane component KefB